MSSLVPGTVANVIVVMREIRELVSAQKLVGERESLVDGGDGIVYDFPESLR